VVGPDGETVDFGNILRINNDGTMTIMGRLNPSIGIRVNKATGRIKFGKN
jgi:hypothetical protein